MRLTKEVESMMISWRNAYFESRQKIEISEKGSRWEFDNKRIFKETDYIARVSNDLHEIATILLEFCNLFGPYLKSIINDPAQLDAMIERTNALKDPFLKADYNVFIAFNEENWKSTLDNFKFSVAALEEDGRVFLEQSFRDLTSSEESLKTLLQLRSVKTRSSLESHLENKYDSVIQQFNKEIDYIEVAYNRGS